MSRQNSIDAVNELKLGRQRAMQQPLAFYVRHCLLYAGTMALIVLTADTASIEFMPGPPRRRLAFVLIWGAVMAAINLWDLRRRGRRRMAPSDMRH